MKTKLQFLFFALLTCQLLSAANYDIKTGPEFNEQPMMIENYKDAWYVLLPDDDKAKNELHFKLMKYDEGLASTKTFIVKVASDDKTKFLCASFINNKFCIFLGKSDKRIPKAYVVGYGGSPNQLKTIVRQDFDPGTLSPAGGEQTIFDSKEDGFDAYGVDIKKSEDGSKTAELIYCYAPNEKFKLAVLDKDDSKLFSKVCQLKETGQQSFPLFKVNNNGAVLLMTKPAVGGFGGHETHGFYTMDKNAEEPHHLKIDEQLDKELWCYNINAGILNNDDIIIVHTVNPGKHAWGAKSLMVYKYKMDYTLISKKEIPIDQKYIDAANQNYQRGKIDGLLDLKVIDIVPLSGEEFSILCEQNSMDWVSGNPVRYANYILTYQLDEHLNIVHDNLIDKAQRCAGFFVDRPISFQAIKKDAEVYLFHNESFGISNIGGGGTGLLCTRVKTNGSAPETDKVKEGTRGGYVFDMQQLYENGKDKLLFLQYLVANKPQFKLAELTLK